MWASKSVSASADVNARTGSVFVANGAKAVQRSIRTGAAAGDWVEVTGGLRAGERVITRGVFNVKAGDPLAIGQVTGE